MLVCLHVRVVDLFSNQSLSKSFLVILQLNYRYTRLVWNPNTPSCRREGLRSGGGFGYALFLVAGFPNVVVWRAQNGLPLEADLSRDRTDRRNIVFCVRASNASTITRVATFAFAL